MKRIQTELVELVTCIRKRFDVDEALFLGCLNASAKGWLRLPCKYKYSYYKTVLNVNWHFYTKKLVPRLQRRRVSYNKSNSRSFGGKLTLLESTGNLILTLRDHPIPHSHHQSPSPIILHHPHPHHPHSFHPVLRYGPFGKLTF